MNVEMPNTHCCCNHMQATVNEVANSNAIQHTSASSSNQQSFSAVFSMTSITTYFNPNTGGGVPANYAAGSDSSFQSVLLNLPDVRHYFKPWYFPDAQNQNITYVRTVAMRIVNENSQEHSQFFQTVFNALKEKNGLSETTHASCCHPGLLQASDSTNTSDPLSDDDKQTLEAMHHYAEDNQMDTQHVNSVATQLASDKLQAAKNQQTPPTLSRDYFDNVVQHMSVWKNTIQGNRIIEHLNGFFS